MIRETGPGGQRRMSNEEYRQKYGTGAAVDPRLSMRGARNREAGASFEALLAAGCEHYRWLGVAHIEKTPEPMAPIQRLEGGRFIAIFAKKAQCDYKGTLAGGRSVVFEAKRTEGERILQSSVTTKQRDWMEGHHRLGALCFVAVCLSGRDFYRVSWPVWQEMKAAYGRKYMTRAELEPYRVPRGLCRGEEGMRPGVLFLEGLGGVKTTEGGRAE